MDVATRLHQRAQGQSFLDIDKTNGDVESTNRPLSSRHNANDTDDSDSAFKKPSIPASASRPAYMEQRATFTKRRSTMRDNARVPSGPRDYPSPQKRQPSISSAAAFLPDKTAASSRDSKMNITPQHFNRSNGSTDGSQTPAEPNADDFSFVPSINFDDFQDSMGIRNYDSSGSLLGEFPGVPAGRLPSRDGQPTSRSSGSRTSDKESGGAPVPNRRLSTTRSATTQRQVSGQSHSPLSGATAPAKSRRQASISQTNIAGLPDQPSASSRAPRKSVGPGVIPAMMEIRKSSLTNAPMLPADTGRPQRSASINKARRMTVQPTAGPAGEQSRLSAFTATTQSRANKVKSMIQPSHPDQDPNTPLNSSAGRSGKNGQNRAHTPSSSGNKRQSTMSGRISGLGARTISPTDARRMKRMSMMPAPPLPSSVHTSSPPEEVPIAPSKPPEMPEMPRFAQPSPSLIPRMTRDPTPTSGRPSPDGRPLPAGGISLSTKSSFQSLLAPGNSTSRLPTPRVRNVHSSTAQYGDEEMVPPVPAIPKAYESPRDQKVQVFATSAKSSQSTLSSASQTDVASEAELANTTSIKQNGEAEMHTPQRRSEDRVRAHKRTNTLEQLTGNTPAEPSTVKRLPDATGRKNNSLQPLSLPPFKWTTSVNEKNSHASRPSQDLDGQDVWMTAHTPEPKRTIKTPSTPMTASKANPWKRQEEQKMARSSSSHFALRDMLQLDPATSRFFDDDDMDVLGLGSTSLHPDPKARSAITPFASGSLPKGSSEYLGLYGRPSAEYESDRNNGGYSDYSQGSRPVGPRPKTTTTATSGLSEDASVTQPLLQGSDSKDKKESTTTGLRRKLSLGWKRSSSKASNHPDNKNSPTSPQDAQQKSLKGNNKLHKRMSEMPPPRLPASASAQWPSHSATASVSETMPSLPGSGRPSMESIARRKSAFVSQSNGSTATFPSDSTEALPTGIAAIGGVKTRSQHSEQPQPVASGHRTSSWSLKPTEVRQPLALASRPSTTAIPTKHKMTPSTFSASLKDQDDLAADDEMRRLSQKRKDVDTAAKESEKLKARAVPRGSITADRALHDRSCNLNIYERGEILDFDKDGIYFTGTSSAKKIIGNVNGGGNVVEKTGNFGYDDERGDYNIVLGDHLAYRYEVVDVLGKGSFGQVVRCVDHKEGGIVAVKIIRNKKRFHQQALVEVGILGRLRDWDPNGDNATLSITSSFYFRSHLCIVTPCLSINLYELIRAHNFSGFSLPLIRRFARQLLACLVLLQRKRIIHCDLKPENILLCEARKADVRVIDFGSSCKEEEKVYTYIQSRFYRSPEVILGSSYGLGIDMWSFGCILAELWTGYPIFPGENEQEQLACIMEIFGPPDRHLVDRCTRKKLFFDSVGKPRVTVSSKGRRRRPSSKTLAQALKSEDEAFVDFIARCLRWDPDRRMKPAEAVSHPFIANLPLNRGGIPEEARRVPKPKPISTTATTNAAAMSSPTKKLPISGTLASQQTSATPSREKTRQLPETPQTVLRAGPGNTAITYGAAQGSPNKMPGGPHRRHSTVASAGSAAAVAGSKRANNNNGSITSTPNLAQLAAKESMGGPAQGSNNNNTAPPLRWRG